MLVVSLAQFVPLGLNVVSLGGARTRGSLRGGRASKG